MLRNIQFTLLTENSVLSSRLIQKRFFNIKAKLTDNVNKITIEFDNCPV